MRNGGGNTWLGPAHTATCSLPSPRPPGRSRCRGSTRRRWAIRPPTRRTPSSPPPVRATRIRNFSPFALTRARLSFSLITTDQAAPAPAPGSPLPNGAVELVGPMPAPAALPPAALATLPTAVLSAIDDAALVAGAPGHLGLARDVAARALAADGFTGVGELENPPRPPPPPPPMPPSPWKAKPWKPPNAANIGVLALQRAAAAGLTYLRLDHSSLSDGELEQVIRRSQRSMPAAIMPAATQIHPPLHL